MKILFDCTELSYYDEANGHRAGVFNVALNLFNELKDRGYDITFYCDFRRYFFMQNIEKFKDVSLLPLNSFLNKLLAKFIYNTRNFPYLFTTALRIASRYYDEYFYHVSSMSIEQIKTFDCYLSPFSPASKDIIKSGIPCFRMLHDIIPILEHGKPKSPKDWYYTIYNRISKNAYYFTNSECTRNDILKHYPILNPHNIITTLLGVNENFKEKNIDLIKYGIPKDKKYVFSLCTIGKRKNLIFAIKNFFEFINKYNIKDLVLVLGGSSWKTFEGELNKVLNVYDKSKIIVTGYVPDEDLPALYSNAFMFVYPSLYEGFGLPVLESMKCKCPVITSNVSSLPEVIGKAGIQVDPTSDNDMINAYHKMYYDNFYRELCRERGLIRSNRFTWKKCCDEIIDFIETKLNQSNI